MLCSEEKLLLRSCHCRNGCWQILFFFFPLQCARQTPRKGKSQVSGLFLCPFITHLLKRDCSVYLIDFWDGKWEYKSWSTMSGHGKRSVNARYHHWYIGLIVGQAPLQELGMQRQLRHTPTTRILHLAEGGMPNKWSVLIAIVGISGVAEKEFSAGEGKEGGESGESCRRRFHQCWVLMSLQLFQGCSRKE